MRTEKEILDDIKKVEERLVELCGKPSIFGIPQTKYIDEYDSEGNWIGAHMDPEVEKCYQDLEELYKEYRSCGYEKRNDRGEYSGSSNGW